MPLDTLPPIERLEPVDVGPQPQSWLRRCSECGKRHNSGGLTCGGPCAAKRLARSATPPEPLTRVPITGQIPPIPYWAQLPEVPLNPEPKTLRWDPDKRAFRLINPTCAGDHGHSRLTGERLTCGLCDGRSARPEHFRPGAWPNTCVTCGTRCRSSTARLCHRCAQTKKRVIAAGITVDDALLLAIQASLRATDLAEAKARQGQQTGGWNARVKRARMSQIKDEQNQRPNAEDDELTLPHPQEGLPAAVSQGAKCDILPVSPSQPFATKNCTVCSAPFRAVRTDAKFCSPACRKQASRRAPKQAAAQ
jgi:hypothetical protein